MPVVLMVDSETFCWLLLLSKYPILTSPILFENQRPFIVECKLMPHQDRLLKKWEVPLGA